MPFTMIARSYYLYTVKSCSLRRVGDVLCCNFHCQESDIFVKCKIFRSSHLRNRQHHLLLPWCLWAGQHQLLNWGLKMTTPANCSHGDQSLTTTGDAELELTKPFLFDDAHKLDRFCQSIWAYSMKPISRQFTFIDFVVAVNPW